jgi:hypothetical protein
MYRVIYKIDVTGLILDESQYLLTLKRVERLICSLPDYILEEEKCIGINIPAYDPDGDYILTFTLIFRDSGFLEEGLKFLTAYCILNYIEPDQAPIISTF